MKNYRFILISLVAMLSTAYVTAQTADEIINNYIQAIGGKDNLVKITSLYTESNMEVMGSQGTTRTTVLNGKGMKQETDIMGALIVSCYTDKGGWSINPMAGSTTPEDMSETQYKAGKNSIIVGAPFINYAEQGYKTEMLGTDSVGKINTFKVKITTPDTISAVYYFDTSNYYLVKSVQQAEMQGQTMENVTTFSDYRKTDNGILLPFAMEISMADGQFVLVISVTKVEFDKPVDEAIFAKQ